jgi:hypothetical protein
MKASALYCIVTSSLLLGACASDEPETPADHIGAVQAQLNEGNLEAAEASADTALGEVDGTSGAGLELQGLKLQAMARREISPEIMDADPEARDRQTESVTTLLKELHSSHPEQFGYEDFLVVGAWLAEAGDCSGAVSLLDEGNQTFESHTQLFETAVFSAGGACGGGEDELLQQLQSLGYI